MGMIFRGHKWHPDPYAGWRFCTCLNRCGWKRITTSIPGEDEVEYFKDDFSQDFEPVCEVEDDVA